MQDPENRISRRTALKGAAASGVGIVVGRSLAEQSSKQMGASSEAVFGSNDEWFTHNGRGA